MLGVLVNCGAVIVATLIGLLFRRFLSQRLTDVLTQALGMCALIVGIRMALRFENVLEFLLCIVAGGAIGTWLRVEHHLDLFGLMVQKRVAKDPNSRFAAGFSTASIMFCVGAMAVVGPINSALLGDNEVMFTKALLDAVFSVSLASVYGIGVAFSALPLLIYQGAIALLAGTMRDLATPQVLNDISGVGGVLVAMIGLNQIGVARIAVGDYLPAMGLVIVSELVLAQFGMS